MCLFFWQCFYGTLNVLLSVNYSINCFEQAYTCCTTLQVFLQKLSQMAAHEEDMDLFNKAAVKRRKRNPGGNPSQKRPYYGELEDYDLGKATFITC